MTVERISQDGWAQIIHSGRGVSRHRLQRWDPRAHRWDDTFEKAPWDGPRKPRYFLRTSQWTPTVLAEMNGAARGGQWRDLDRTVREPARATAPPQPGPAAPELSCSSVAIALVDAATATISCTIVGLRDGMVKRPAEVAAIRDAEAGRTAGSGVSRPGRRGHERGV